MDLVNKQSIYDKIAKRYPDRDTDQYAVEYADAINDVLKDIRYEPSAEPEIIYCKDCKHWTQTTGKMKGYGLGKCDFHDADLVTCNAYCYWAERRSDE
jgi:hypothetical protein